MISLDLVSFSPVLQPRKQENYILREKIAVDLDSRSEVRNLKTLNLNKNNLLIF